GDTVQSSLIPADCRHITPGMLPLVDLTEEEIDFIVQSVPGGATNIADIYPLAPLQEGILFHHLLDENRPDTYLLVQIMAASSPAALKKFLEALQWVIDRHDMLRTAIVWERLRRPVQVVHRRAVLSVTRLSPKSADDPVGQLKQEVAEQRRRLLLDKAPLMRVKVLEHPEGSYLLLELHHIVCDHESLDMMLAEATAKVSDETDGLPEPVPYRVHVAQALEYARGHDAAAFFTKKLGDVDEPTAPVGLSNVHRDGTELREARHEVDPSVATDIRSHARRLGVSPATLFHAAWALVVAKTSSRDDVVFGNVLLGRLQGS